MDGVWNGPRPVGGCAASKVLVVDLGFLGDTVHLVPALWELRRHHPASRLDVVTTRVGAEVLGLVPCVDRVWVYPLGKPSPPWWRHLGLQWRLAAERYDLAFNFSGADRTLFVTALAGVRKRVTRQTGDSRWWQRWLAGRGIPAPSRGLPVFEQRRQVLAAAGYALETARFDLRVPAEEEAWAEARVPRGAVHVSVNASTPFKEWPVASWAGLVRWLLGRDGGEVVATGSGAGRERGRLAELVATVNDRRLRVMDEGLSIARLGGVLSRCRLHLGTDSGVTHLAMALGVPTISVFRRYAGLDEWRPRGPGHEAVVAVCECADRSEPETACRAAGAALCLARISWEEVAARITSAASAPSPT